MKKIKPNWELLFEITASRQAYKVTVLGSEYFVYNHDGIYFSLFLTQADLKSYLRGEKFVRVDSYASEGEVERAISIIECTQYVLFGKEACEAVDLGRAIPQNANYSLKEYTIVNFNVNKIISDSMGWNDYRMLTPREYYKLKQQR